jgi:hypothetical protein
VYLNFGFTQLFKQEFSELSKQAVSTITGLITIESNSELEACALKLSTIKSGLLEISEWIQSMLFKLSQENFSNFFSSESIMSNSTVFSNFKESIKACDSDN